MKTIAILQSNYIPWKGYFDMIARVDEFVLFDDVQYTRRDWRNRNKIKTPAGPSWLTIPVTTKGRYEQLICETEVDHRSRWTVKHWSAIQHHYARAPYFERYAAELEQLYLEAAEIARLSTINHSFIAWACAVLGIDTRLSWSMDYAASGTKTARLLSLCASADASAYVSGPAARAYIDPADFAEAGVELQYMNYEDYADYPQLHGDFAPHVSIIDLILNAGPDAATYMNHVAEFANG